MTYAETITVQDLEADPYPAYARLRAEEPVAWVPAVNLWLVTRAADVETVTTKPDLFSAKVTDSPLDRSFGGPTILTLDGAEHLDLRRSLDTKYRPRTVATYIDDLVTPIAQRFLDRLLAKPERRAELIAEYLEPISVLSLGAVLGLGHLSESTLQEWFHGLAMGAINFENDPEKQRISDATASVIDDALRPLMTRLRAEPDDSTIAPMLTSGCPVGQPRSIEAVMPSLKVIILGGMQEPGHGAASTLAALLADREQLDWVRTDAARWDDAVHEGLRWVAPIGTQTRQTTEAVEARGHGHPRGLSRGGRGRERLPRRAGLRRPRPLRRTPHPRAQRRVRLRPALLRGARVRARPGADRPGAAGRRAARPAPGPGVRRDVPRLGVPRPDGAERHLVAS